MQRWFVVLLFFLFSLFLPGVVIAQSDLEEKKAIVNKLLAEGLKLRQEKTKESLELSMPKFKQALDIIRTMDDQPFEANILFILGSTSGQIGDPQKALEYYTAARAIFRSTSNPKSEATTLTNIGDIFSSISDQHSAIENYTQALSLREALGDDKGKAVLLNNLGLAHSALAQWPKALDYFAGALSLSQAVRDRMGEATSLSNLGVLESKMGATAKALEFLMRALPIRREIGDRDGEAVTLEAIAGSYHIVGEKQRALDFYVESLSVAQANGNRKIESSTLNNLGELYDSIGESEKALDYFSRALQLKREIGDVNGEATTLANIGTVNSRVGDKERALAHFSQALKRFRELQNRRAEARILINIGSTYDQRRREAFDSYSQALEISKAIADRQTEATALNNLAGLYDDSGEDQKALAYYEQALRLLRDLGDRRHEAGVLSNIASLEAKRGNLLSALPKINSAVDLLESIRGNIVGKESRSAFFASVHNHHEFLIGLLIQLHKQSPKTGYDALALRVSERARARVLLELLEESHAKIREGIDPALLEQKKSLQRQLAAKSERRAILLSGRYSPEEASTLAAEIEKLITDYRNVENKIRQSSTRYSALTQPETLDLSGIQSQLDADTLLLEYVLANEKSYLWLVSPTGLKSFELPARNEIEQATRKYYSMFAVAADPLSPEMDQLGVRLSRMLLGPVASYLGGKRLVIVADGALHYLPFAALPDPASPNQANGKASPLILNHEIVSLPSLSVLATLRNEFKGRKRAPKEIAVLADPVFSGDDKRVVRTGMKRSAEKSFETVGELAGKRAASEAGALRDANRLERLPATRKEADGIVALVPSTSGLKALDFAASRDLVNSGELNQYRYITFATHGLLDSVHPELTAIVFSLVEENGEHRDGYLRSHEVYNLNLSADLVVLSACTTALGKEVRGEGLIGLTRGFMYAGAPRVVASLWTVNDDSTAHLMISFYRGMIREGKRPAEALRAAQLELLRSKNWSSPHHWSAFVMQGEWR